MAQPAAATTAGPTSERHKDVLQIKEGYHNHVLALLLGRAEIQLPTSRLCPSNHQQASSAALLPMEHRHTRIKHIVAIGEHVLHLRNLRVKLQQCLLAKALSCHHALVQDLRCKRKQQGMMVSWLLKQARKNVIMGGEQPQGG